jgi:hypothetical protein
VGPSCVHQWAASSVGRAPRSQRGGQEFEPPAVHQNSPAVAVTHSSLPHAAGAIASLCGSLGSDNENPGDGVLCSANFYPLLASDPRCAYLSGTLLRGGARVQPRSRHARAPQEAYTPSIPCDLSGWTLRSAAAADRAGPRIARRCRLDRATGRRRPSPAAGIARRLQPIRSLGCKSFRRR